MTELKNLEPVCTPAPATAPVDRAEELSKTIKKVAGRVLKYVPGLIIFGLIALYYISLSHLA